MVRAVALAIVVSSCAYDYDGAFGEATTGTGSQTGPGGRGDGGAGGVGEGAAGGNGDGGDPTGTDTTTTTDATTTGTVCVCAFPGTCDGNNQCICPSSVAVDRFPTIGEGTNGGNQGWSNVGFITAADGNAASVHLNNNQTSEQLTARGFDFSEIPNDATIIGIHVDIDRCRAVETGPVDVQDTWLRLASAGSAVGSGPTLGTWGNCGGAGGSYEFPVAGIGPAQVKNDFGVQLRIKNFQTGSATGYVNFVSMRVTYQPTCTP